MAYTLTLGAITALSGLGFYATTLPCAWVRQRR